MTRSARLGPELYRHEASGHDRSESAEDPG